MIAFLESVERSKHQTSAPRPPGTPLRAFADVLADVSMKTRPWSRAKAAPSAAERAGAYLEAAPRRAPRNHVGAVVGQRAEAVEAPGACVFCEMPWLGPLARRFSLSTPPGAREDVADLLRVLGAQREAHVARVPVSSR